MSNKQLVIWYCIVPMGKLDIMCLPSTNACRVYIHWLVGPSCNLCIIVYPSSYFRYHWHGYWMPLCEDCNISSHNFEETSLKYGKSGKSVYFATDLVYSNYDGTNHIKFTNKHAVIMVVITEESQLKRGWAVSCTEQVMPHPRKYIYKRNLSGPA